MTGVGIRRLRQSFKTRFGKDLPPPQIFPVRIPLILARGGPSPPPPSCGNDAWTTLNFGAVWLQYLMSGLALSLTWPRFPS